MSDLAKILSLEPREAFAYPTRAALLVSAGWGFICSSIFFFNSLAVGSALWVAIIHAYPSGSMILPQRLPQNMSITGP